ncbi:MAG: hypothetical protein GY940_06580 [bacterium]|nr:hypothetical protein [bacterium]
MNSADTAAVNNENPSSFTRKSRRFIALLLIFAAGFGLVSVFLIPPFMNPDEIQHFMFSANYAYDEEKLKQLDKDVLQLLKDHRWFHFIGVGPGWENTQNIKDIYFIHYFAREKHTISKTYFHFLYGKLLKLSGIQTPISAFYFLRFLSFLVYLSVFLLSVLFYRGSFPSSWKYLASGQLLLVQPALILNSVNYDVLFTLLGVLFFMVAYRFMSGVAGAGNSRLLLYLTLLSALAVLIKKGGLLFFVYVFLLLLFKYPVSAGGIKKFLLGFFIFGIVFSWFNYLFPGRFFSLYITLFGKLRSVFQPVSEGDGSLFNFGFFDSLLDSFYFYTGWMGFKIDSPWYLLVKIILLTAIIGIIAALLVKKFRTPAAVKKWHFYVLVIFLFQVFSIWIYYGSSPMAQGRYLLPILIPVITLIYGGLYYIEEYFGFKKHYLLVSSIIIQVLFLVVALVRVISVFYLEIASPHPGL